MVFLETNTGITQRYTGYKVMFILSPTTDKNSIRCGRRKKMGLLGKVAAVKVVKGRKEDKKDAKEEKKEEKK